VSVLLQDHVDRQAAVRGDATAIVAGDTRTTFGELASGSDRLARLLADSGCAPGDRVCFLMPKSPAAIITMLGVLKAGCVYVPMDPSSPAARLALILDASQPRWLLVAGISAQVVDDLLCDIEPAARPRVGWMAGILVDGAAYRSAFGPHDLEGYPERRVDIPTLASDPAHILFTSGSTGRPKGVVITHRNVTSFLDWAVPYFGMTAEDRTSGHSPLHFDLSTFDVFGSLAAGAELHLIPPELNLLAPRLAAYIRDNELTQWFSVPSVLSYMARFDVIAPDDFPALRRLLWCGEVFPTPALRHWMQRLPEVTFTNLYGPTEATIASSYHTLSGPPERDDTPVSIGVACGGEELLVLDDTLRPVPAGTIGDLYIGGDGLSPGYWQDLERTTHAFRILADGRRVYRTGDLAHLDDEGRAWFHGRTDLQIKSRGYRIELGEIETALRTLPAIGDCAVVAIETGGFEGSTICCAYVAADGAVDIPDLRRDLARLLPGYMLPSRWLALGELPLNVNGKVDRPALQVTFRGAA
jgi:amino acid adenylation domain-containing protein